MYIYCPKRGCFLMVETLKDIVTFYKIDTDEELEIGNFVFHFWELKRIYNQLIIDAPDHKPMSLKALRKKAKAMDKQDKKRAKKERKGA